MVYPLCAHSLSCMCNIMAAENNFQFAICKVLCTVYLYLDPELLCVFFALFCFLFMIDINSDIYLIHFLLIGNSHWTMSYKTSNGF